MSLTIREVNAFVLGSLTGVCLVVGDLVFGHLVSWLIG